MKRVTKKLGLNKQSVSELNKVATSSINGGFAIGSFIFDTTANDLTDGPTSVDVTVEICFPKPKHL